MAASEAPPKTWNLKFVISSLAIAVGAGLSVRYLAWAVIRDQHMKEQYLNQLKVEDLERRKIERKLRGDIVFVIQPVQEASDAR